MLTITTLSCNQKTSPFYLCKNINCMFAYFTPITKPFISPFIYHVRYFTQEKKTCDDNLVMWVLIITDMAESVIIGVYYFFLRLRPPKGEEKFQQNEKKNVIESYQMHVVLRHFWNSMANHWDTAVREGTLIYFQWHIEFQLALELKAFHSP